MSIGFRISMTGAVSIVLLLAAAYTAVVGTAAVMQGRMLFLPGLPGRAVTATPAQVGLDYENVTLTAVDGVKLAGWWLPQADAPATVLFCHGNAGNISHRLDSLKIFAGLGLNVLIFDYRGYGESEGRPTEDGLYRDAEAAWRHLIETRTLAPGSVILFGRSLGAAVAAHQAARATPGALILESAFTSVPDLGAEIYWFMPVRLLSRFRFDTRAEVAAVRSPVLIVHSRDDEIIPFRHAEALFAAAPGGKAMLTLRGDHNSGFLLSGDGYVEGLAGFLRRNGLLGPS